MACSLPACGIEGKGDEIRWEWGGGGYGLRNTVCNKSVVLSVYLFWYIFTVNICEWFK